MTRNELRLFLDEKSAEYNSHRFIETDPIQIPHGFERKHDKEISAFLTAVIAWGQRPVIINNGLKMMRLMDNEPYEFVMNATANDLKKLKGFVHRTFNGTDLIFFVKALKQLYKEHSGLEGFFSQYAHLDFLQDAISDFKTTFFMLPHEKRSEKHLSDPRKGSCAKRINMFLRWMVRKDSSGVDFGLWRSIKPASLSCPLDVHSGRIARKLGLLNRKQNDAKALNELDVQLRQLDPTDPVKYDYALFGLGVFEKF